MLDSAPSTVESIKITHALEDQRQILSQEIHDTICQSLAALKVAVQTNSSRKEIITQIDSLIDESRALLRDLRQETKEFQDVIKLLQQMIAKLNRSYHPTITFHSNGKTLNLPYKTSVHITRIIQEALINAITHAKATRILVTITQQDNQICFTIDDNGVGFKENQKTLDGKPIGYGIHIMKERTKQIVSSIKITSYKGRGTQIKLIYQK